MGGPAAKESAVVGQVHAHTHLGAQGCCQVGCQPWALRLGTGGLANSRNFRPGQPTGTGGLLGTRAFQVRPGQPASLAAALKLHLGRLGPTGRLGAHLGPTGRLANAITVTKHAPI